MPTSSPLGRSKLTAGVAVLLLATAGAAMGWIGVQLYQLHNHTTFPIAACKICGHVERVRELERASPAALPLNGDQCESIVMMIAALGGRIANASAVSFRTYETAGAALEGRRSRESAQGPRRADGGTEQRLGLDRRDSQDARLGRGGRRAIRKRIDPSPASSASVVKPAR